MDAVDVFRWVGTIAVFQITIPATAFIYRYARFSPWRRTIAGRIIMYQKIAIDLLLIIGLARIALGDDSLVLMIIRVCLYIGLGVMFWRMLFLLVKIQRKEMRQRAQVARAAAIVGDD